MGWWKSLFGGKSEPIEVPEEAVDDEDVNTVLDYEEDDFGPVILDEESLAQLKRESADPTLITFKAELGTLEPGESKTITLPPLEGNDFYELPMLDAYKDILPPPVKPLDLMKVRFSKAANQSKRKDKVRGICLHHIMMGSFKKNEEFLITKVSGVSAHYLAGRNAELVQMVNTTKKAWHAGVSSYEIDGEKRSNLNNCLIGIEIVNPGYLTKDADNRFWYNCGGKITEWKGAEPTYSAIRFANGTCMSGYSIPYTPKQLKKLVALCKALVKKYPQITRDNIVTHYQIAEPVGRKNDPFGFNLNLFLNQVFDEK